MIVKDRDFVQQRKVWRDFPDASSHVIHFKSVETPKCPEYKKYVRAHTNISGYFIKTVSLNPLRTLLVIVAQNDLKGMIPKFIVNKVGSKKPREWIENLKSGVKELRKILANGKRV